MLGQVPGATSDAYKVSAGLDKRLQEVLTLPEFL
jgi:hypothetical protein